MAACLRASATRVGAERARAEAEAVERVGAALPVAVDLHLGLEVHAGAEQRLELLAGRGARLAEHRAALADHDALLRVALDAARLTSQREHVRRRVSALLELLGGRPRSSAAARRARRASSFSRTSSAARNVSGWSLTTPSG